MCDELARFAEREGVVSLTDPREGEIYLIWSAAEGAFTRAGIVVDVDRRPELVHGTWVYPFLAVEGNTSDAGCAAGPWIHTIRRELCPARGDRLIRWADLDRRESYSAPARLCQARRAA